MKKWLVAVFLLVAMFPGQAQNDNALIEQQFKEYSQLVIDQKIDAALEYTNEDLFTIIPREQLKTVMESIFNMPSMQFKASMPEIISFDPIKNLDGAYFVRFKHKATIEMKFIPEAADTPTSVEEQKDHEALLLKTFKEKYGEDNVTFDQASGFYKIKATKIAIAKSRDRKQWKFAIIDNPNMKMLLEKFLPKELLD